MATKKGPQKIEGQLL